MIIVCAKSVFIEKRRRSSLFGQNWVLRYGHFSDFLEFFEDRMANLGLMELNLVCISKLMYIMSKTNLKFISQNIWPKWPSIGTK